MLRNLREGRPDRAGTGLGVLLILIGAGALLAQLIGPLQIGAQAWPLIVIAAGAAILVMAFVWRPLAGLAVPGAIVVVVGGIVAVQNAFDLWATWSYAWALVAPGAVGLGIAIAGAIQGNRAQVASGLRTAATGLVLFAVLGAILEGIVNISGRQLGQAGRIGLALVLVVAGVALMIARLLPPRRA